MRCFRILNHAHSTKIAVAGKSCLMMQSVSLAGRNSQNGHAEGLILLDRAGWKGILLSGKSEKPAWQEENGDPGGI